MSSYLYDETSTIMDKDGNPLKVSAFRSRDSYATSDIGTAIVRNDEFIRIDLLADRLVGGILGVGRIIDCNDKDILSFSTGDKIKYSKRSS